MSKKRLSSEDTLKIDRKRSKIVSIEPTILSDINNNNNLYKNLFLYEALHDFSKSRGTEEGLTPSNIRNDIGLYKNATKFPIANDEDRFIEDIDNGQIYDDTTGSFITDPRLSQYTNFTNSIDYYKQYVYKSSIGHNISSDLISILANNDVVEVYFDYYKENSGKWLDLTTINTLKAIINYLFRITDDNKMRFLVDTCKLNLAMVYYNTDSVSNSGIYQVVDETNKWDMASTRKNKSQLKRECSGDTSIAMSDAITMNIPISNGKSKKEFRKISYNLLSENLMEPLAIDLNFPENKLDSRFGYFYIAISGRTTSAAKKSIEKAILDNQFVNVPTNTYGLSVSVCNLVYADRPSSICYSTTIIRNISSGNIVLLVNPYAYSGSEDSMDEEDSDKIKGVFSVNEIKTLLDSTSTNVYKNLSSIHDNIPDTFKSLLFDIKRSGDWSQILAVYRSKETQNNVFITIDRMAFAYARLLRVPAILTSKDFGSDTYRFKMYRDKSTSMSEGDRKIMEDQLEQQILRQEQERIEAGITKEYTEKYELAMVLLNLINGKTFSNNIDAVDKILLDTRTITNKSYIEQFILALWNIYKTYITSKFNYDNSQVNSLYNTILAGKYPVKTSNVQQMLNVEISKLDSIISQFNELFNIQKYIDSGSYLSSLIYNPSGNSNNKLAWLQKVLEGCIVYPAETRYMAKIVEGCANLFIGSTKRTFKINEDSIISIIQAVNGLTTIAGLGSVLPVLTKLSFNASTLENWFNNATVKISALDLDTIYYPHSKPITKVASKPVHRATRSKGKQKGGAPDINYKYYIPIKVGRSTATSTDVFELFWVLDEYLGYIAHDTGSLYISSNKLEYRDNSGKTRSKYANEKAMAYIANLFTPTFLPIIKTYIKYTVSNLGLAVENIDDELASEQIETQLVLKYLYRFFYNGPNSFVVADPNNIENHIDNVNSANNYLDELENNSAIDDSQGSTIVLPIEHIYNKLEKDITNSETLDNHSKLVYYYVVAYAITDLGINLNSNKDNTTMDSNEEPFVVEQFAQYYSDLDTLIQQFSNINTEYKFMGGATTDLDKHIEYRDYFRHAVSSRGPKTSYELVYISKEYLDEFVSVLFRLNRFYIEKLMTSHDSDVAEIYIGLAATIKSSAKEISLDIADYIDGYRDNITILRLVQKQCSKLAMYHDSTLMTFIDSDRPLISISE